MKSLFFGTAVLTLMASASVAVVVRVEPTMQDVLDSITTAPITGASSVNAFTDALSDSMDSLWSIGAPGGSVMAIIVDNGCNAGENTLGVYDGANPANMVELFSGANSAGDLGLLGIASDGSVYWKLVDTGVDFAKNAFGFYLGTPNGMFFSDTRQNSDGMDHMYAYEGVGDTIQIPPFAPGKWQSSEYIIGWADLYGVGDRTYSDFVVIVESVTPIPEPATLAILGLGSVGLLRSRKRS